MNTLRSEPDQNPLSNNGAFTEILSLIRSGQNRLAYQANTILIETYWSVGEYLSRKVSAEKWGKGVVKTLAEWLAGQGVDAKGFSLSNMWRMKQFYEQFSQNEKLVTLSRELSWSHCTTLTGQCKSSPELLFYADQTVMSRWSVRELRKQIASACFERTALADAKLTTAVRELPQDVTGIFKDSYLVNFANLSEPHLEKDLQSSLVANLRDFLLELGRGFTFVGEKVRVQVGNKDFELDLLFYHRDLQCLVAFELKTGDFEPAHLGQLSFYLEALDRQEKRPHENPSIGVLLCRTKDDEVVEIALSRTLSPALVAEYETRLIDKDLLRRKMNEWYELLENQQEESYADLGEVL